MGKGGGDSQGCFLLLLSNDNMLYFSYQGKTDPALGKFTVPQERDKMRHGIVPYSSLITHNRKKYLDSPQGPGPTQRTRNTESRRQSYPIPNDQL